MHNQQSEKAKICLIVGFQGGTTITVDTAAFAQGNPSNQSVLLKGVSDDLETITTSISTRNGLNRLAGSCLTLGIVVVKELALLDLRPKHRAPPVLRRMLQFRSAGRGETFT
jgi:hypothetical protein